MFLPDRYVRGTCPVCSTPDQYGDSCESCGATYSPLELKDAVSTVSGTPPTVRESEHLFLKLERFRGRAARVGAGARRRRARAQARRVVQGGPQGLGHLARRALLRLPHSRRARQVLLRLVRRADRLHGELPESLPPRRHRLRRVLGRRQPARALSLHRQGHPVLPRAVLARDAVGRAATASRAACSCTAM